MVRSRTSVSVALAIVESIMVSKEFMMVTSEKIENLSQMSVELLAMVMGAIGGIVRTLLVMT